MIAPPRSLMLFSAATSKAVQVRHTPIDRKKVLAGASSRPSECYRLKREARTHEANKNAKPPWRPRLIATPSELLERFVLYATHVKQHPFKEEKVFFYKGEILRAKLRRARPLTLNGFCIYLGITSQAWRYWRRNRGDLSEALELIESAIYANKFEGAAAGLFKVNIISRELGGVKQV